DRGRADDGGASAAGLSGSRTRKNDDGGDDGSHAHRAHRLFMRVQHEFVSSGFHESWLLVGLDVSAGERDGPDVLVLRRIAVREELEPVDAMPWLAVVAHFRRVVVLVPVAAVVHV